MKALKNKRRKRCVYCGRLGNDVEIQADPYLEEITGRIEKKPMCKECYQQSAADI